MYWCIYALCIFFVFVFLFLCMRSNYQFDIAVQVATLEHFSSSCNAYIVWIYHPSAKILKYKIQNTKYKIQNTKCMQCIHSVAGWIYRASALQSFLYKMLRIERLNANQSISWRRKSPLFFFFLQMLYHIQSCGLYLAVFPFQSPIQSSGSTS